MLACWRERLCWGVNQKLRAEAGMEGYYKDVDPQRCQVVPSGGSYLIECRRTECRTCQVTYVITTLAQEGGLWTVSGTRRVRRGDTGECGCCM